MAKLAVYCGAASGFSPLFEQATKQLGKWMVENNLELIYGGGKYGLMGTLAQTVSDYGGKVHGIVPEVLYDRQITFDRLTDLKVVGDMSERKKEMLASADASLALPGGPGTLEEISQAFSWARIGENPTPSIIYNVADFYAPLEQMYDAMVTNGFLTKVDRQKLLFSESLSQILAFMHGYTPPEIRTYQAEDAKQ